jgi:selenocysteine lyase/cysteine desulfurase
VADAGSALLGLIRRSVIGCDEAIETPFGDRRITYADYTASGRALSFIEDVIRREVLPLYANTHTETSGTGRQTTRFREEARGLIKVSAGAGPGDVLVFCGSGATSAVHTLIDVLNLSLPGELAARYDLLARIPPEERPVVFIGPYEHHSNELPWRESIADVVVIHEDAHGRIDAAELARYLAEYAHRPLRIGSFSAASNVTGLLTDTATISRLLHQHGALSFWDFAAAAPYVDIAMNGDPGDPLDYKDAAFLSPHKFVGGPGTPGVLLAKRALFRNRVPTRPGGGTVDFVTEGGHRYVAEPELREEGGTPAIIESIRAGLVFHLKEAVGTDVIHAREREMVRRVLAEWERNPALEVLGPRDGPRLAILSFVVRYGGGRYLHHDLVVALLNDLFGIQARGGCSCAGPYGARLLGIAGPAIEAHVRQIEDGCRGLKPGWTRVGFNYFISEAEVSFLIRAVDWVASHGWKLLPWYDFDPVTGDWRHRDWKAHAPMSLHDVHYEGGELRFRSRHTRGGESALAGYLAEAERIRARAEAEVPHMELPAARLEPEFEQLRWFPLAHEVAARLRAEQAGSAPADGAAAPAAGSAGPAPAAGSSA